MYRDFIKRAFDLLFSTFLLIFLSPLMISLIVILNFTQGSVFFLHNRPGKNERIFKLFKFKTMTDQTDNEGKLLPDTQRLTRIGKFIRSASMDELPQLLNVLKGDMSLIGPRPLLIKYLPLYNAHQKRRHEVRPGITGWAQVNGRNAISWEKKFDLDVWYVDHVSFWLDIKILFLTLKKIIKREGINFNEGITMAPFSGSDKEL